MWEHDDAGPICEVKRLADSLAKGSVYENIFKNWGENIIYIYFSWGEFLGSMELLAFTRETGTHIGEENADGAEFFDGAGSW